MFKFIDEGDSLLCYISCLCIHCSDLIGIAECSWLLETVYELVPFCQFNCLSYCQNLAIKMFEWILIVGIQKWIKTATQKHVDIL